MLSLYYLCNGFLCRPWVVKSSWTEIPRGRDGSTQDHAGLFSYLAAVSATGQIPGTKLLGIDSAVKILIAIAHFILDHRQLGLLEKANTESPWNKQ